MLSFLGRLKQKLAVACREVAVRFQHAGFDRFACQVEVVFYSEHRTAASRSLVCIPFPVGEAGAGGGPEAPFAVFSCMRHFALFRLRNRKTGCGSSVFNEVILVHRLHRYISYTLEACSLYLGNLLLIPWKFLSPI